VKYNSNYIFESLLTEFGFVEMFVKLLKRVVDGKMMDMKGKKTLEWVKY